MENLLNKLITITGIEQKVTQNGKVLFKVKDQDNRSYQLWKTKQDGTDTMAYQGISSLPNNGINSSVEITYKETQGDYNGKPVTYRSIIAVKPNVNVPASTNINNVAKGRINGKNEEEKWKEINDKKRADIKWMNALNNACLLKTKGNDLSIEELANMIYKLEPNLTADNIANMTGGTVVNQEQTEEYDTSNIPF